MRDELTHLTAHWLAAGHTSADVHEHVLRGLPGANTPVHRPGGLLRYLLRDVPPLVPAQAIHTGPRLSPRLTGTRECEGDHVQPMLFRPLGDETHCAECARDAHPRMKKGGSTTPAAPNSSNESSANSRYMISLMDVS